MLPGVGARTGLGRGAVHGGALPAATAGDAGGRAGLCLGPHHGWGWTGT